MVDVCVSLFVCILFGSKTTTQASQLTHASNLQQSKCSHHLSIFVLIHPVQSTNDQLRLQTPYSDGWETTGGTCGGCWHLPHPP